MLKGQSPEVVWGPREGLCTLLKSSTWCLSVLAQLGSLASLSDQSLSTLYSGFDFYMKA